MLRLAIMQGRLSPPEDHRIQCFPRASWRDEFPRAAKAGIPAIEWIDDAYGADINPLRSREGIGELRKLMDAFGITIPSICADIFMEEPLIRCSDGEREDRVQLLMHLLSQAQALGAQHIGIPLLDHSALKNVEEIHQLAHVLQRSVSTLEKTHMEVHLETSLSPEEYPLLLSMLPHPLFRVTYDTGNSASLGYDPHAEFAMYGDRIGSVHIKDRKRGGGTVMLGTGDTDFTTIANELKKRAFDGCITLQAARGNLGNEVEQCIRNRAFCEHLLGDREHHSGG